MLRPSKKPRIVSRTTLTNRTPASKEIAKEKARKTYEIKTDILTNVGPNAGPGLLQAPHIGSTTITYEWGNSCTNCSGVSLYHSTGSTKPLTAAAVILPTSTSFSFQNLQPVTEYYVWVEFFNQHGIGVDRTIFNTTNDVAPDADPFNLSITPWPGAGATTLHLMWQNTATNEDGVYVYRNTINIKPVLPYSTLPSGAGLCHDTNAGCTAIGSGLTPDTEYFYWVSFFNEIAESNFVAGSTSTYDVAPDADPGNLAITPWADVGATTLHLMWSNTATNEDGIYIYRSLTDVQPANPYITINDTGPNQCYDSNDGDCAPGGPGLDTGTEYFYWVSFFNEIAESNTTSGSTFTLEVAPNAQPTNLSLVPGATSIAISFTNNATNDDGVKIYRALSNFQPLSANYTLTGTNITSYTDDDSGGGLDTATEYFYWVSNFNEIAESNTVLGSTFTLEVAPDAAPSNLTFVPGATSIALTFTNNATNDDGVKIYRALSNFQPLSANYTLTGTNITGTNDDNAGAGLTEGTTYYYWVSNYNEIAESSVVSGATTTQTSGTTWYHAHGGAMELQANAISTAGNIRLNYSISTSTPPTITTGDYIKIDDEEMLVGIINHPSRPNVTRGVNGTTAAFHFAGSDVYVDHNTDGT